MTKYKFICHLYVYVWLDNFFVKNRTNQTKPHWFGLVLFLKSNRTKPNRTLFPLVARMTFSAKISQTAPWTPLLSLRKLSQFKPMINACKVATRFRLLIEIIHEWAKWLLIFFLNLISHVEFFDVTRFLWIWSQTYHYVTSPTIIILLDMRTIIGQLYLSVEIYLQRHFNVKIWQVDWVIIHGEMGLKYVIYRVIELVYSP